MDPLARSGLDYIPSTTVGVGQADTGLRIAKNVMDFNVGFLNRFVNGGKSTLNFVRSLGTAQGWKNIGQGFVNFAEMANIYSVNGLMMRTQMGMAVNDYVSNIPNMSAYELGHDSGFLFEKVVEVALVSQGTSLTVNAVTKGKTLFNFTKTAGAHMDEVGRMIPVQTLDDIIKAPTHVLKDPQGTKALMHYSQMWKNGKLYNVEVLYNKASIQSCILSIRRKVWGHFKQFRNNMFEKDDKRRLYWLMDSYLSGKIDERTFCDEYYYSYDLEVDYKDLSPIEEKAFSELSAVSSRFSEFEEDHKLDAKAFSTVEELKRKVRDTQEKLKAERPI
jgi:hypothetical protein